MVAAIQGPDGRLAGVHRTWLARGGAGKAEVKPNRMMLGRAAGGAVRSAPVATELAVAEGIETALAVVQAAGMPAWAALSTSGLRALELPPEVRQVLIFADGDPPGEAAARAAAGRWLREGRRVRIARPPAGMDANALLVAGAA
jgi:putative DNA primase/helicase